MNDENQSNDTATVAGRHAHLHARVQRAEQHANQAFLDAAQADRQAHDRQREQREYEERTRNIYTNPESTESMVRRWHRDATDPDSAENRAKRAQAEAKHTAAKADRLLKWAESERGGAIGFDRIEEAAALTLEALTLGLLSPQTVGLFRLAIWAEDGNADARMTLDMLTAGTVARERLVRAGNRNPTKREVQRAALALYDEWQKESDHAG